MNVEEPTGPPTDRLPLGATHSPLAVDVQEAADSSTLRFTRQCLHWRKGLAALRHGSMHIIEAGEALLVFERAAEGQRLRCTFNLSADMLPFRASGRELISTGDARGGSLPPYAGTIEEIV